MTETKALVHVTTENGIVIDTTENHPFYVEEKGWAAELEAGDVLRTKDWQEETVVDVIYDLVDWGIDKWLLKTFLENQ